MTQPKSSSSYPLSMHNALADAVHADVIIETDNPRLYNLKFNGLRGALRKEGKSSLIDSLGFYCQPGKFIIRHHDNTDFAKAIDKALLDRPRDNPPPPSPDVDDMFARLLQPKT